ncbi:hypothetical protein ES708_19317 [subsurface metagenome]
MFFSYTIYSEYLEWLNESDHTHHKGLKKYFLDYSTEINRALLHLEEINNYEWHDHFEMLDEYEIIRFIDQRIHPSYLRLIEAVLSPFLHVVAYFSRIERNKGAEGLDTWCIIQELKKSKIADVTKVYHHVLRNAIAHGGITYLQRQIKYKDKKGNEEKHDDTDVVRKFDDLLDTCNALSVALSVFLLSHQLKGYRLPQQLFLEELSAETWAPWWEIVGCTPSKYENINQLIIYSRPHTSDTRKVRLSTFQSGVFAELFAPGYDRYFFSIKSKKSWQGYASFNGKGLYRIRKRGNAKLEYYKGLMEQFFFHVPGLRYPQLFFKIETWIIILRTVGHYAIVDFKKELNWPEIYVREIEIHRNAWGCVLNGSVYLTSSVNTVNQEIIRKFRRRIISNALTAARDTLKRTNIDRYLPVGFARIAIFQKDYRQRRLKSFGLDKDLICTIQFQRIRRIKCPDILGSTVEQLGKYRIAWNKAWLESRNDKQT